MNVQFLIAAFFLLVAINVNAQGFADRNSEIKAGFWGPIEKISKAKQVLNAGMFSDDMQVTLVGRIRASLGGEMYLFADSTGEVTVEIEDDKWLGQSVTPTTSVLISGEIDKSISGVKVEVDVIKAL